MKPKKEFLHCGTEVFLKKKKKQIYLNWKMVS